jgi:hypothetical protein
MPIDWSDINSRKIRDAFRVALSDDKALSHAEVVEVLRTALDDGTLSGVEINDLQKIAKTSETIMPRSKQMLLNLAYEAYQVISYGPIEFSTSRQKYAAAILCDFLKRNSQSFFPRLDRDRVGIDLLLRVSNPNIINQQNAGLCGPVSFLYSLAFDSPALYAKLGIDLFETGKAKIGRTEIDPSSDCRNYFPPPPMSHGEWLTAGSLRDSENFFFDYDSVNASGGSQAGELARWFERAGYTDVHWDKNRFMSRGADDIGLINKYYDSGYRVVLSVNSKLLYAEKQAESSGKSNHLVVLRSPIKNVGSNVQLTIYTWGKGQFQIPQGKPLTKGQFLEHWYGYVAAKPF